MPKDRMTIEQFMTKLQRAWWWSPHPPYKYIYKGQGWANLVEVHSGMFNLAWASSGAQDIPKDYIKYASKTSWAFTHSKALRIGSTSIADLAMTLPVVNFCTVLTANSSDWLKWKLPENLLPTEVVYAILQRLREKQT